MSKESADQAMLESWELLRQANPNLTWDEAVDMILQIRGQIKKVISGYA